MPEITAHLTGRGFPTKALVIVTTLRDPKAYPAREIAQLYRRRWAIEPYLRDIKTAMGADVLRCARLTVQGLKSLLQFRRSLTCGCALRHTESAA